MWSQLKKSRKSPATPKPPSPASLKATNPYPSRQTKQKIITTALTMGYDRSKIKTTLYKIVVPFFLSRPQVIQDVYFTKVQNALKDYGKVANMELHFVTGGVPGELRPLVVAPVLSAWAKLTREELSTLHQMNLKSGIGIKSVSCSF